MAGGACRRGRSGSVDDGPVCRRCGLVAPAPRPSPRPLWEQSATVGAPPGAGAAARDMKYSPLKRQLRATEPRRGGTMALKHLPIDQISEDHLRRLIEAKAARETYGNSDAERAEFLADVSSFANAMRGDLWINAFEMSSTDKSGNK